MYKIKALDTPLIWLDTFVILYLKKIQNHESLDPKNSKNDEYIKNNVIRLFYIIKKKKSEKKLICPEGEQDVEIFFRYDKSHIRKCQNVMDQLSSGVKFLPWSEIRILQMEKAMKAYLLKQDSIILDTNDIVNITRIDNSYGFRVHVNITPSNNTVTKWKNDKANTNITLEELRKKNISNGKNFIEQLNIEWKSVLNLLMKDIPEIKQRIFKGFGTSNDFDVLREIEKPNILWEQLNKTNNKKVDLESFLKSDYYKLIPYEYISSHIFSKILTSERKIKSGDFSDIENLSSVIPYCDYVLTDGPMKKIIQSLNIDKKYDTEMYCLKDLNLLCNKLEEL